MHGAYNTETFNNDVALLKLDQKIKFSAYDGTVAPVCMPEEMTSYNGETVTVAGWGLQDENGDGPTDKVRYPDKSLQNDAQYFSSGKWI